MEPIWKDPTKELPTKSCWVLGSLSPEITAKVWYNEEYKCFLMYVDGCQGMLMAKPIAWTEEPEYPKFSGVFNEA